MKVRLTAGDRWISVAIPRIFEGLPVRYAGRTRRRGRIRRVSSSRRRTCRRSGSSSLRKRFEDATAELAKIPLNGVRVNAVEIGGPYS